MERWDIGRLYVMKRWDLGRLLGHGKVGLRQVEVMERWDRGRLKSWKGGTGAG